MDWWETATDLVDRAGDYMKGVWDDLWGSEPKPEPASPAWAADASGYTPTWADPSKPLADAYTQPSSPWEGLGEWWRYATQEVPQSMASEWDAAWGKGDSWLDTIKNKQEGEGGTLDKVMATFRPFGYLYEAAVEPAIAQAWDLWATGAPGGDVPYDTTDPRFYQYLSEHPEKVDEIQKKQDEWKATDFMGRVEKFRDESPLWFQIGSAIAFDPFSYFNPKVVTKSRNALIKTAETKPLSELSAIEKAALNISKTVPGLSMGKFKPNELAEMEKLGVGGVTWMDRFWFRRPSQKSRAIRLTQRTKDNLIAHISSYGTDVDSIAEFLTKLRDAPMQLAEEGMTSILSAEGQKMVHAIQDLPVDDILDSLKASQQAADTISTFAQGLGRSIDDVVRMVDADQIDDATLTAAARVYKSLPTDPEAIQGAVGAMVQDHLADFANKVFKVPEKDALLIRVTNKIKAYETYPLLFLNPGYLIQNVVNGDFQMVMDEIYSRPKSMAQLTAEMKDMAGFLPARFAEGIGQAGKSDAWGFGKLAQSYEGNQRARGFVESFRRSFPGAWKQLAPEMPEDLRVALGEAAPAVEAAIRSSYKYDDIVNRIFSGKAGRAVERYVPDLAESLGIPEGLITDTLGFRDLHKQIQQTLDGLKSTADAPVAFAKLKRQMAEEVLRLQRAQDAYVESAMKLKAAGPFGAFEILDDMFSDSIGRFADRAKMWDDLYERAYAVADWDTRQQLIRMAKAQQAAAQAQYYAQQAMSVKAIKEGIERSLGVKIPPLFETLFDEGRRAAASATKQIDSHWDDFWEAVRAGQDPSLADAHAKADEIWTIYQESQIPRMKETARLLMESIKPQVSDTDKMRMIEEFLMGKDVSTATKAGSRNTPYIINHLRSHYNIPIPQDVRSFKALKDGGWIDKIVDALQLGDEGRSPISMAKRVAEEVEPHITKPPDRYGVRWGRETTTDPFAGGFGQRVVRLADDFADTLQSLFSWRGTEEGGFLLGRRTPDGVEISKVVPVRGRATGATFRWGADEWAEAGRIADAESLEFVGTIHTHPPGVHAAPASQYDTDLISRHMANLPHIVYQPQTGTYGIFAFDGQSIRQIGGTVSSTAEQVAGGSPLVQAIGDFIDQWVAAKVDDIDFVSGFMRESRTMTKGRKAFLNRKFAERIDRMQTARRGVMNPLRSKLSALFPEGRRWAEAAKEASEIGMETQFYREGLDRYIGPLLDDLAHLVASSSDIAGKDIDPKTTRALRSFLEGKVRTSLGDARNVASAQAEAMTDFALLNYSWRTNLDTALGIRYPYMFWTVTTLRNYALRMFGMESSGKIAAFFKYKRMLEEKEENIPSRLRGMFRVQLPFAKDWMGDGFIDPLASVSPISQFIWWAKAADWESKYEELQKDLEYARTHGASPEEIAEIQQALQKAPPENPMDILDIMMGPHLAESWLYKILDKKPLWGANDEVGPLPPTRWIRGASGVASALGAPVPPEGINIEAPIRGALRGAGVDVPMWDDWEDYRVFRMLSNMAAMKEVGAQDALLAMIEKQGPYYEKAQRRALEESSVGIIPKALGGMRGAIYPVGEQQQRILADMYTKAKEEAEAQGKELSPVIQQFIEQHPEITVKWATSDRPIERTRDYLINKIWETRKNLPALEKKKLDADLKKAVQNFDKFFLNSKSRDYAKLTTEELQKILEIAGGPAPSRASPGVQEMTLDGERVIGGTPAEQFAKPPEHLTQQYDQLMAIVEKYGGDKIYEIQNGYYKFPQGSQQRRDYLAQHPELKAYWEERRAFLDANPELNTYLGSLKGEPAAATTAPSYSSNFAYYGGGGGGGRSYGGRSYGGKSYGGKSSTYQKRPYSWSEFTKNVGPQVTQALLAYASGKPLTDEAEKVLMAEYEANKMGFKTFEEWLEFMLSLYQKLIASIPPPYQTAPWQQQGRSSYPMVGRRHISWR